MTNLAIMIRVVASVVWAAAAAACAELGACAGLRSLYAHP